MFAFNPRSVGAVPVGAAMAEKRSRAAAEHGNRRTLGVLERRGVGPHHQIGNGERLRHFHSADIAGRHLAHAPLFAEGIDDERVSPSAERPAHHRHRTIGRGISPPGKFAVVAQPAFDFHGLCRRNRLAIRILHQQHAAVRENVRLRTVRTADHERRAVGVGGIAEIRAASLRRRRQNRSLTRRERQAADSRVESLVGAGERLDVAARTLLEGERLHLVAPDGEIVEVDRGKSLLDKSVNRESVKRGSGEIPALRRGQPVHHPVPIHPTDRLHGYFDAAIVLCAEHGHKYGRGVGRLAVRAVRPARSAHPCRNGVESVIRKTYRRGRRNPYTGVRTGCAVIQFAASRTEQPTLRRYVEGGLGILCLNPPFFILFELDERRNKVRSPVDKPEFIRAGIGFSCGERSQSRNYSECQHHHSWFPLLKNVNYFLIQ